MTRTLSGGSFWPRAHSGGVFFGPWRTDPAEPEITPSFRSSLCSSCVVTPHQKQRTRLFYTRPFGGGGVLLKGGRWTEKNSKPRSLYGKWKKPVQWRREREWSFLLNTIGIPVPHKESLGNLYVARGQLTHTDGVRNHPVGKKLPEAWSWNFHACSLAKVLLRTRSVGGQ